MSDKLPDENAAPLILGDRPVSPAEVAQVSSGRVICLGESGRALMRRSHGVMRAAIDRGDAVYGADRGVGALKTVTVGGSDQSAFNHALLVSHSVGSGPPAPAAFVRAAMAVRAAGLAVGRAGVRPELADAFCDALNAGLVPHVRAIGSVGQADLSQMAEIGLALTGQTTSSEELRAAGLEPLVLGPREGLAIVSSNAYSVGVACLALQRALAALDAAARGAALSYEAVLANPDALHPQIAAARPYPGHERARARVDGLIAGGALAQRRRPPRNLQDALCFKGLTQTHGAAHDALSHLHEQLSIELRSSGDSPLVLEGEDRAISTGGHEIAPIALALDYARLALAGVVTIASERVQKLLDPAFTDLSLGLRSRAQSAEDGLAILGHGAASLAAEARLLATPVTLEQPTSSIATGIEDRITMAPVAASRLHEMSGLLARLEAIELCCAARAIELRGSADELGAGTHADYLLTRAHLPAGDLTVDAASQLDALCDALERDPGAVSSGSGPARSDA